MYKYINIYFNFSLSVKLVTVSDLKRYLLLGSVTIISIAKIWKGNGNFQRNSNVVILHNML